MSKRKIITIRLSPEEKRYARELSKRLPGARYKDSGSIAFALKWLLHNHAKKELKDSSFLGSVYTAYNV